VTAGVRRSLALALIARIPIGALSLLIVLAVRDAGHSYAVAGLASGACALGMAISAPLMGRAADRLGQSVVLFVSAVGTAVSFAAFAALPDAAPPAVYAAVALTCGLALPPVSASSRVVWGRMLDDAAFGRIVTLDASLQELAFLIGPLVLVTAATVATPDAALVATGLGWGAVTAAFGALPETRSVGGEPRGAATSILGPVTDPGVRTLLVVAVALGFCIGATELGVVNLAETHGALGLVAVLYGLWSLGSLAGGLLSMRRPPQDVVRRTQVLLVVVSVATAALALAHDPLPLAVLLVFAGVANAPLFGALYTVMARIAPAGMVTEAYSLQTAGLTVGIAVGAAAGGAIAGAHGPSGVFLVAAAGMLVGVAVHALNMGTLRPAPAVA
jgi:MFS family permease